MCPIIPTIAPDIIKYTIHTAGSINGNIPNITQSPMPINEDAATPFFLMNMYDNNPIIMKNKTPYEIIISSMESLG